MSNGKGFTHLVKLLLIGDTGKQSEFMLVFEVLRRQFFFPRDAPFFTLPARTSDPPSGEKKTRARGQHSGGEEQRALAVFR